MKKAVFLLLMLVTCLSLPAQKGRSGQRKPTMTVRKTTAPRRKATTKKQATTKRKTTPRKSQPTVSGLKEQKDRLAKERAANVKKKAELERGVKRGLENLMVLDTEIARQRKVVDTIRNDIARLDAHIALLDSQLVLLEHELTDRRNSYMKSMRYMHRNRSVQNQLMFVFSSDNFNQMYRRMRFNREYASYQKAQGEAVISKQQQVTATRDELAATKRQKGELLVRGQRAQQQLEGKQTEQKTQVDQLKKQQKTVQRLIEQQQRQEAELNARIDQLIAQEIAREKARREAEAKKRREAEAAKKRAEELARKRAAAEAARKENERRIAEAKERERQAKEEARRASREERAAAERRAREAENSRKAAEQQAKADEQARKREIAAAKKAEEDYLEPEADRKLSGSFQANKGRLPVPITGAYRLIRGMGTYTPEGTTVQLHSNGWHLKGQPGSRARCIFDGVVSGVYYKDGFYIVTVRHGTYISAYINLSSVSVRNGQTVTTRQELGSLGSDNTMQFQLRNWTNQLNPSAWLSR